MGKLFGTDGIRGVVGENLTVDLAFKTGKAIAAVLKEEKGRKPLITIGKDTRISSDMLESALIAGICAVGGDVMPFGVLPTPAVAYLTVLKGADAGIVISASHNPYEHNGIKVFNEKGYKLPDETEAKVEEKLLSDEPIAVATHDQIGVLRHGLKQAKEAYINHLAGTVESDLSGLRVLVDCSNGAASATAPELFGRFNCYVDFIHREPDGVNINNHCGSTHLDSLAGHVVAGKYDIGVAFDGDADRCLMVDETGGVIDGDKIMAVCAKTLTAQGKLQGGGFVATVMSNIGLHKYCAAQNLRLLCASVGDRNVLELMQKEHMVLGGEQSGHIIFLEHMPTGDGQLAALQFLSILTQTGKRASELVRDIPRYPQVLINVKVGGNEAKQAIMQSAALRAEIAAAEELLAADGRVLVRASGTEPLIRVMVEAGSAQAAEQAAETLVKAVENLQKNL